MKHIAVIIALALLGGTVAVLIEGAGKLSIDRAIAD